MKIKSFSKINLTLRVLKKFKNGMHNIETNSTLVNLFDDIDIKKNKKDKIIFKGKFKNKINLKKNSIKETIKILRNLKIIENFYKIVVKKNIPVYAGLGGGTSNSASIVEYFAKNRLDKKLVLNCEKKIGSDFRLFLNNNSYQKNLREVFKSYNTIRSPIIIVFPNVDSKTKNVYKAVKKFSPSSGNRYLKKIKKKISLKLSKKIKMIYKK